MLPCTNAVMSTLINPIIVSGSVKCDCHMLPDFSFKPFLVLTYVVDGIN
jgi:hypothetical protein